MMLDPVDALQAFNPKVLNLRLEMACWHLSTQFILINTRCHILPRVTHTISHTPNPSETQLRRSIPCLWHMSRRLLLGAQLIIRMSFHGVSTLIPIIAAIRMASL